MPKKPKVTSHGLPIVTPNTVREMKKLYGALKWGQHLEAVKARMIKENPFLVEVIERQVGKFPDEMHNPIFEIVAGVIATLEEQAKMNTEDEEIVTSKKRMLN